MLSRLPTSIPTFLLGLALLACGPVSGLEPVGELGQGIVRGQPSSDDQNAVVLIVRDAFADWCTGAIVAPNLVLTARHCLYMTVLGENASDDCGEEGGYTPVVSAWKPESHSIYIGKERPLADAVAHGTRIYSGDDLDLCTNDLALLEVDTELPVQPLAVRLDSPPRMGETATLVGWGATVENERLADKRQQRDIVVEAIGPVNYAPPGGPARALEASLFAGTEGGCRGDSGGPLISRSTGAIIGVQAAVLNPDPVLGLDEADAVSQCFGGVSLFQRLDPERDWMRRAFRTAQSAPWIEGHPAPVALGAECKTSDDCLSGVCVGAASSSFCSTHCDAAPCPDGMSCVGPSEDRICIPPSPVQNEPEDAQGCTLARTVGAGTGLWLVLALSLVLRLRHQPARSRKG